MPFGKVKGGGSMVLDLENTLVVAGRALFGLVCVSMSMVWRRCLRVARAGKRTAHVN